MANQIDVSCPLCTADIPLESDAKIGDYVYCSYCEIELRLVRDMKASLPGALRASDDTD